MLVVTFVLTTIVTTSYALGATATITADNNYALYVADTDGNLTFVGRNEQSPFGDPGTWNWSLPETFAFDLSCGYVYVAGWSGDTVASGLLGQFADSNGNVLFTTDGDWQVVGTGQNLDEYDVEPSLVTMQQVIQDSDSSNSWGSVVSDRLNGAAPWGTISGISSSANWIWKDSYLPSELQDPGEFLVFRLRYCPVIEVSVDIKPGSDPNSINLGSNGGIPVAVLGSETFDTTTVDPLSVTLEGASVRLKGKSGNAGSIEDVNGDGYQDLLVHVVDFSIAEGSTEAILTGETYDGTPIQGTDSINIVP